MDKPNSNPAKRELTAERLREIFHYDPETGLFTRIVKTSSNAKAGVVAGFKNIQNGYLYVSVYKRHYLIHRLVWLYVTGRLPKDEIDHINGNRTDNRLSNLRECSHAENMQNMPRQSSNTSGIIGVRYCKIREKFVAQISVNGKVTPLGRFQTVDEAIEAYTTAKAKYHTFQPTIRT